MLPIISPLLTCRHLQKALRQVEVCRNWAGGGRAGLKRCSSHTSSSGGSFLKRASSSSSPSQLSTWRGMLSSFVALADGQELGGSFLSSPSIKNQKINGVEARQRSDTWSLPAGTSGTALLTFRQYFCRHSSQVEHFLVKQFFFQGADFENVLQ